MSPKAGFVLLDQIEPRLRATMPYIRGVGSEDTEELLQDALALAAKMLHDLEERGKEVTPGNVAYSRGFQQSFEIPLAMRNRRQNT